MPYPKNLVTIDDVLTRDYALVIDARSEREFLEDHVPGAMNLPAVNTAEYEEVGTLHRTDTHQAYLIGVGYSLANISHHLPTVAAQVSKSGRILVYCFRGGKRSRLWCDALETVGFKVDRLQGGWKAYRRWVNATLPLWSQKFRFHVLCGPTGCGKTRLLHALRRHGAQVLDLEGLANHRGSLIGAIPDSPQPSQKRFESALLTELRAFDSDRPVWVEAESKKIGARELPGELFHAMHDGNVFVIDAPMAERVQLWHQDYPHFADDPAWLITRLQPLRQFISGQTFETWEQLAQSGEMSALYETLMEQHYDPTYQRSTRRNYSTPEAWQPIRLERLDPTTLDAVAAELAAT